MGERGNAKYGIRWIGEPRPDLEAALRDDIEAMNLSGRVGQIITHTCVLTDDWNGPCVHAHGDPETNELIAEYHTVAEWITLDDLEDDLPTEGDSQ